ncbi:MAG TPA: hypothetical protein VL358_04780 [Caulobacteraceae bacterium]|jgi:hypothetical protein|nr:hypothetical protein [Caulobacteraceae bacterium]
MIGRPDLPRLRLAKTGERELRLPAGRTCADCIHTPICDGLFDTPASGRTTCGWRPYGFVDRNDCDAVLTIPGPITAAQDAAIRAAWPAPPTGPRHPSVEMLFGFACGLLSGLPVGIVGTLVFLALHRS